MGIGYWVFLFAVFSLLATRLRIYDILWTYLHRIVLRTKSYLSRPKGKETSRNQTQVNQSAVGSDHSKARLTVRILISLVVLGASLYIILKDSYSPSSQKWAFGSVGTILGYWLKD